MRLSEALASDRIELNLKSTEKRQAIEEMVRVMRGSVDLPNAEDILECVLEQEAIETSGVERGVAIPHARCPKIEGVTAALGISRSGLDFESLDGEPVQLVFLILSSESSMASYMSVLSRTARIFDREDNRERVLAAQDAEEIMALVREQEPV
ncbi:MAG: PTS sugar transporter subunit IIA [Candidatus Latescibacteria bacterium]|jgi:mannitol/fructose-specific phosphotransferase system IIA component (Ntr-type)|nr:PTS sugar transporter subunit IIA [Candidatus Latescibacterota bacterium]